MSGDTETPSNRHEDGEPSAGDRGHDCRLTGYLHPGYPASLAEFGHVLRLPRSKGALLTRRVPHDTALDAMGCYPLFVCQDWSALPADIAQLNGRLVSLTLVADPFGASSRELTAVFPDVCVPYKEHYVIDLSRSPASFVDPHHRYRARRARRDVDVQVVDAPSSFLDEWVTLYKNLIHRHGLQGIKKFSREAFARQLALPGVTVLRGCHDGRVVAAQLWFSHGDVAYSHLAAASPKGYALSASYALYGFALEYFACRHKWLDLGGAAGATHDGTDGLSVFKRGWATGTRTAYLCGRVLDCARYAALCRSFPESSYFPPYRGGELL
jgi:hypothetical protein